MSDLEPARFPCESLPEDPARARLLGVYPQRSAGEDELFMQRVKAPAGRLSLPQWRGLARVAARFTPDYPLHATTRQNIELHGVRREDLPAVQRAVAALGLTGAAACGDAVRNITVCPRNGCCAGTWDVDALVCALRAAVESLPWRENLPRKFKISVSGCREACARPWINDVGLTANDDGSLRVVLAGSLGVKPGLGLLAYESLAPAEVVPLVVAVLRLFFAEGDRTNRGRARLRHVRQRLGDAAFLARLEELFQKEKLDGGWPAPALPRVEAAATLQARLHLPLGDIAPEAVFELAAAVEAARGDIRLGVCHDLFLLAETAPSLSPRLASLADGQPLCACPGATWCNRGLVDSRAAAGRLRAAMPSGCALTVGIAGCPNNCAQAATADIGLIGRLVRRDGGELVEGFRLFAGGGKGETTGLAQELHPGLPADAACDAAAWLAGEYHRVAAGRGTSFAEFVTASNAGLREELARRFVS